MQQNRLCSTCGKTALYFRREGSDVIYACGDHSGGIGEWKGINAMGGAVLAAVEAGAKARKSIRGD